MSLVHPIDDICRELSPGEACDSKEQLIRTDQQGNRLSGFASSLISKHQFAVRFGHSVEMGISILTVQDFELNSSIDVPVRWRAILESSAEALIKSALAEDRSILKTVEFTMQECLQSQADKRGKLDLGAWIHRDKNRLGAAITIAMKSLQLQVECVIETDDIVPKSLSIKMPRFEVICCDSTRKVGLSMELRIDPLSTGTQSGPNTKVEWDRQLCQWASGFIESRETLDAYYRDERFDERLRHHLSEKLGELGWELQRFFTNKDVLPSNNERLTDNFMVKWTSAQGRVFEFSVKLGIDIHNLALYDRKGTQPLRQFAQQNLDEYFDKILFSRDIDTLSPSKFKEAKNELHQLMSEKAAEYGLYITTLVPDPVIPEWQYLNNQRYLIPARDYATLDPGTSVNFDINIEGRILSIDSAFVANSQPASIAEQVEAIVTRKAEEFMRQIDLHVYINHFAPKPNFDEKPLIETSGKKYLHDLLTDSIEQELLKKFDFKASYINIQRHDPDIKNTLEDINNFEPQNYEIEVQYENYFADEFLIPFSIKARFLAPSIEYVAALMSRDLDMPQMVELVRTKLKGLLDGRSKEELAVPTSDKKDELSRDLQDELNPFLNTLGMEIRIESIERGHSVAEQTQHDLNLGLGLKRKQAFVAEEIKSLEHDASMREKARKGEEDHFNALNNAQVNNVGNGQSYDTREQHEKLIQSYQSKPVDHETVDTSGDVYERKPYNSNDQSEKTDERDQISTDHRDNF